MKIQAAVLLTTMPNFVKATCLGQQLTLDVGELSEEDAAALWDHWKHYWLEHVAKRRSALGKSGDTHG
jgi:hypothetical protein